MNKKTYKKVDSEEAKVVFERIKTYEENSETYYDGFDLMTPNFFKGIASEKGCQYLIGYLDEKVFGVLKWKRYGIPNHDFVKEEELEKESYLGVRFIDIHKDQRRKGLAKEMISYWSNNILKEDDIVVGGRATPLGKETNIHGWFEKNIQQKYYVSEIDLIEEWEEENTIY